MQSSDYDLKRIAYFSRAIVSSAGRLELDLRVTGTIQQPQAYGTIEEDELESIDNVAEFGETHAKGAAA